MQPALTVILAVHNGADSMSGQLDALVAQQWSKPYEILVVDNLSTDSTPEIAAQYVNAHDNVRAVTAHRRKGLSHARNVGVAHAQADAVAFCDDDDIVGEGWVAAMGDALRTHPIVACRFEYELLNTDETMSGHSLYQSKGVEKVFGYPIAVGPSGWQVSLWNDLHGNDEDLDVAGEDFDMVIRANLLFGIEPYFAGDAIYHKAQRRGVRPTFDQARRYGRSHVQLYEMYGKGRVDVRQQTRRAVRQWLWLARHAGNVRHRVKANQWAWHAGNRVGRLEQSLRSRTFLP
jgi:glycosyltransferase involved in cell wall biosynthesis